MFGNGHSDLSAILFEVDLKRNSIPVTTPPAVGRARATVTVGPSDSPRPAMAPWYIHFAPTVRVPLYTPIYRERNLAVKSTDGSVGRVRNVTSPGIGYACQGEELGEGWGSLVYTLPCRVVRLHNASEGCSSMRGAIGAAPRGPAYSVSRLLYSLQRLKLCIFILTQTLSE